MVPGRSAVPTSERNLQKEIWKKYLLLGFDYFVSGIVEHGRGMGRREFFPTANLIPLPEKLLPPNGVYITLSSFGQEIYPGITNVGYKPTVGENFIGVESYLFDCEKKPLWKKLYCRIQEISQKRTAVFFL